MAHIPFRSFAHLIAGVSRVLEEFVYGIFNAVIVALPRSAFTLDFLIATHLDSCNNFSAGDARNARQEHLDLILCWLVTCHCRSDSTGDKAWQPQGLGARKQGPAVIKLLLKSRWRSFMRGV
jgi:hypothetical protein